MSKPRRVRALHLTAARIDTDDQDKRELSGTLLPYGEVGYTSIGPVIVPGPGRIKMLDADLTRIKLVDEHQRPPVPIGYMTDVRDTDTALRGSYYVGRTLEGERAWSQYNEKVRDAFSVELIDIWLEDNPNDPGVPIVVEATLKATAFVTTPAWANARPDGLAASYLEGTTMTDEQRARLRELTAMNARDEAQETEFSELRQLAVAEAIAEDEPDPDPAPASPAAPVAAAQASRVATAPGGGGARRSAKKPRQLTELFAAMARVGAGESRAELEAALSDITSTANIWTSQNEYAGQLWSGLEYQRRFVQLMTPGKLTSYKGTGWRWVVKPAVADYAGDKAAVPSNAPTTQEVAWQAARLAGAHDIDRKFWDFGDQEFIAAYFAAMRESYAIQSDAKARAFLLASATSTGAASTSLFKAAAIAAQAVETNTNGQKADYFLISAADQLSLLDITEANVPAYLETFGVTPDKFIVAPGQVAKTVTAGTKSATTFKELGDDPIRVEGVQALANGGIDGGVFGYYATLLNWAGGVAKTTWV